MKLHTGIKEICKVFIANDILDEVLELLDITVEDESSYKNEIILKKQQYHRVNKSQRNGVLTNEEFNIEINKISSSLLSIIDLLKEIDFMNFEQLVEEPSVTDPKRNILEGLDTSINEIAEFNLNENRSQANLSMIFLEISNRIRNILERFASETNIELILDEKEEFDQEYNLGLLTVQVRLFENFFMDFPTLYINVFDNYHPSKISEDKIPISALHFYCKFERSGDISWFVPSVESSCDSELLSVLIYSHIVEQYKKKIPFCKFCGIKIYGNYKNVNFLRFPSEKFAKIFNRENMMYSNFHHAEICSNCIKITNYKKNEETFHTEWETIFNSLRNIKLERKKWYSIFFPTETIPDEYKKAIYEKNLFQDKYSFHINFYVKVSYFLEFGEVLSGNHYFTLIDINSNFKWSTYNFPLPSMHSDIGIGMVKYNSQTINDWVYEKYEIEFSSEIKLLHVKLYGCLNAYTFISADKEKIELLKSKIYR